MDEERFPMDFTSDIEFGESTQDDDYSEDTDDNE